jgi:hypothetical protein
MYSFLLFVLCILCMHICKKNTYKKILLYIQSTSLRQTNNHRALLLQKELEKSERHIEIAERREHLLSRAARIERHRAAAAAAALVGPAQALQLTRDESRMMAFQLESQQVSAGAC